MPIRMSMRKISGTMEIGIRRAGPVPPRLQADMEDGYAYEGNHWLSIDALR